METPSAPPADMVESLPRECEDLNPGKLQAAKNVAKKFGKSLQNACLFIKDPTNTGRAYFTKRALPADGGRRKTRRTRKNKKRQQKKSRKNYK
jgi:hypothetical protein